MMDDLLNRVKQSTGLSHEQAQGAVNEAIGFLKEKLPAPLAHGLDSLLHTGSAAASQAAGAAGQAAGVAHGLVEKAEAALGNMLGTKKS